MNDFFVNNITNRLVDWYTGRYTIKAYHELMDTQWMSAQEIMNYQNEKLKRLIRHAYSNVQYYRDLFDSNKLKSSDIKTVDDLKKLPISTKKSLKEHPNYPNSMLASDLSLKNVKVGSTGGTTGEPLKTYKDVHTRSYAWAAYWRWFTWMGMEPNEKTVSIWGEPIKKGAFYKELVRRLLNIATNAKIVDAFTLDEKHITNIAHDIERYKPSHIRGYTSALCYFARQLERRNICAIQPKSVSTTAETLDPVQRKLLQRVFNCPVYDQYGGGECNSIAFECNAHNGLHIASEHCYVEVLNDENDKNTYPDKTGRIVITDLDNLIMPIIRYETGDYGELSEDVCECGRQLPLIKKIGGRTIDMIQTKTGVFIYGDYFTHLLNELGWYDKYEIEKYQFVQEDLDRFCWYLIVNPVPARQDTKKMLQILQEKLESSDVEIKFVEDIPAESSGKFRYIKSMVSDSLP